MSAYRRRERALPYMRWVKTLRCRVALRLGGVAADAIPGSLCDLARAHAIGLYQIRTGR